MYYYYYYSFQLEAYAEPTLPLLESILGIVNPTLHGPMQVYKKIIVE